MTDKPMKKRRTPSWQRDLAKRPTRKQVAALHQLHGGNHAADQRPMTMSDIVDTSIVTFYEELEAELERQDGRGKGPRK